MKLTGKRIVVTGGAGFLGSHVIERVRALGVADITIPRSREYDIVDAEAVKRLYRDARPQVVFHLAARVGGIGANQRNPGRYFHDNLLMGVNVLEQARHAGVEKIILVGTICSYPKFAPVPFREDDLWSGYPEETNAPYGVAKKALLVMAQSYREQYGLDTVCLLPVNLYGPRDNFDLESSHVIPAMIRKCIEARQRGDRRITLWGDGSPTREFLYVDDCARALVLAAEGLEGSDPVNLGTGSEISIRDLATLIARLTRFEGSIEWDTGRPNGQPRRCLDTTRALERFDFRAEIPFEEGLRRTITWYEANAEAR